MNQRARWMLLASGRPPWRPISQTIFDWQVGSCRERTPNVLIMSRMGKEMSSAVWPPSPKSPERLRRLNIHPITNNTVIITVTNAITTGTGRPTHPTLTMFGKMAARNRPTGKMVVNAETTDPNLSCLLQ